MQLSNILKKLPNNIDSVYQELEDLNLPILDLSNSLNTFDLPEELKDSMNHHLHSTEIHYINYALGNLELRKLIAQKANHDFHKNNITEDNVAITSGARHAISILLQALINPLEEVLVFSPYWTTYINLIKLYGGTPKLVPLDEEDSFYPDFSLLEKACTSKTKVMILNNPHNPTGIVWDKDSIKELVTWAKQKGIFIIADELFAEILYDNVEFSSPAHFSSDFSNLAIVRAFSKSLPICGWRVGWIITNPDLVNYLQIILQATLGGVHTLSQQAIVDSWEAIHDWTTQTLIKHQERKECLFNALNKLHGFRPINPQAGLTIFANIQYYLGNEVGGIVPRTDTEFVSIIYKKTGIKISTGESFGSEGFVRLAFCEDTTILEDAVLKISQILEK